MVFKVKRFLFLLGKALYKKRASRRYGVGDNVLERYMRWFGEDSVEFVVAKVWID